MPKVFREAQGLEPGDQGGELSIMPFMDPESFVEDFCSITKKRLTRKIDIKRVLEEEVEERHHNIDLKFYYSTVPEWR
ncbi:MAG: hypothetical protein QXH67_01325 [Candidatus Bathyarchaeia archaeon]